MSSEPLSHDEAISQFCGITGADEDRAKVMLEACDWNLTLAINMHVDTADDGRRNNSSGAGSSSTTGAGPSTSSNPGTAGCAPNPKTPFVTIPDSIDDDDDDVINISNDRQPQQARRPAPSPYYDTDDVRPPIPPVRQVLVQSPGYSSDRPRTMARRGGQRAGAGVYDAFRDFQAEAQWQEMAQESLSQANSDPSASANLPSNTSIRTLQELFRPPLELMYRGSLLAAREYGQTQNKWLLVNIQNGREFACQMLNRDVWSNQTVKDILKEHFVFWQVYHDSYDGSRYIQFYKVSSFPHVSIIDPRTGEQMKSWPTTIDHTSFCDSVIEFLTEHPTPDGSNEANSMKKLRVKEEETARTLYDQSEEAQLEAAIKASLQETENSNPSSKVFVDEDSYTDAIESDIEQPPEIEDYKKYLGSDKKHSDLNVRFPDGTRDQFQLPSDSMMKALFLLLTSRGYGMNQFNYVTNFPRRLLHELPETDTLLDAKLIKETIFVERRTTS